jgi:hypothetical protein
MAIQLKDVIHLYLGQPVSIWNDVTEVWIGYRKMTASDLRWILTSRVNYKILLRPLESMTDVESKEVLEIAQQSGGSVLTLGSFMVKTRWDEVDYLLAKGFDLFGLIESGQAIDKTTLQQS